MNTFDIINPSNTGSQGISPSHSNHGLHWVLILHGYQYSHSTPIGLPDSRAYLHHTYKLGSHNVGVSIRRPLGMPDKWDTSVSSASGLHHTGYGSIALDKHLTRKARRYPELKQTRTKLEWLSMAQDTLKQLAELRRVRTQLLSEAFSNLFGRPYPSERDKTIFGVCLFGSEQEFRLAGPLIAGVESTNFSETTKQDLRANATAIDTAIESALWLWKKSGRRADTFRRELSRVPMFGSRY